MPALGPFPATFNPLGTNVIEKIMVLAYIPEIDGFLAADVLGRIKTYDRVYVTMDWHYDDSMGAWRAPDDHFDADQALAVATRALEAISEYGHIDLCPNRNDFSVWDCSCNTLKPDQMARVTLDALEELHGDTDRVAEEPEAPGDEVVGAIREGVEPKA